MGDEQIDMVKETETKAKTSQDAVVLLGKYELGEFLGTGASAKVYRAKRLDNGNSVAVKSISKNRILSQGLSENMEREISVTRRLRHHPNIINLHEVLATRNKIYLIMEYAAGGELFQEIARDGRMTEDLARKYFRQLISAVKHCHKSGVFHRDLKLDNLLLDEDGNLKVTDFGLSAVKDQIRPDGLLHTVCGTPAYVAPEILGKKGYDGAMVDVWSCGVVLFAMTAGYLPFNDQSLTVLYRKIYRGQFRCPKWMSCELKMILSRLLDVNPQTRITIDDILEDSWFNTGGYIPEEQVSIKETETEKSCKEIKTLNAFDLILFSKGLDLSGLFGSTSNVERLILKVESETVLKKVEEVAEIEKITVRRIEKGEGVRLEGQDGNLIGEVVVYRLTDELVVLEVKTHENGVESRSNGGGGGGGGASGGGASWFWKDKLRPQLLEFAQ